MKSIYQAFFATLLVCLLATTTNALFCGDDNCYELLGVPRNSSKSEIRRAYRRISQEKHPDKRPGDEAAVEEFRKIGTAYETLTDDAKRVKYDDFLDNPTKYWQYLMENAKDVYAPKSNVFVVIVGILGIATFIHWLNMNHTYKETLRRMKESQEFQREVTKLVKSKQAATREEAEAMINLDVVGLEQPNWRNLIVFKMLKLPQHFASFCWFHIRWILRYKLRKLDYTAEDQVFMIMKHMEITEEDWRAISEKDKSEFLKEQLWDKEKFDEYMRLKRIAMNRVGKGKKKRRQAAAPYADVDDSQVE